jgi:hypothetical protein
MHLALTAVVAALQPFGTADFVVPDGERYVAQGDYPATAVRVLDTNTNRWRRFAKDAGCGPNWVDEYRPIRSRRLLLTCEGTGPVRTYVMFLRTGATRRLRGGTGFYANVGAWWANSDRTYVSLRTGHRAHVDDSRARDLDDPALQPVRVCQRFRRFARDWELSPPRTWAGHYRVNVARGGRLVLCRCDGHDTILAERGASSVTLSAGIVTWRRGLTGFAYDTSTGRRRRVRRPGVRAENGCQRTTRRTGSVLHTRRAFVWRAVARFDDLSGGECLPGRFAGFSTRLSFARWTRAHRVRGCPRRSGAARGAPVCRVRLTRW